jgi:hypothetical protein
MGGGGAGGFGGSGHAGGGYIRSYGSTQGYAEDWMASTKKTLETELKFRGVAPEVITEIVSKIEEPSYAGPVWIAILATALVLTLIFITIWESTP